MSCARTVTLFVAWLSSASMAHACSIERAHYRYTVPGVNATADFAVVVGDALGPFKRTRAALHLRIPSSAKGKEMSTDDWFLFDQGSSLRIYLMESTDRNSPSWSLWEQPHTTGPLSALRNYFAWDSDHVMIEDLPLPKHKAPKHIFLPELPALLPAFTGSTFAPGMFELDHCEP